MDWFLYDNGLRHERVNLCLIRPVLDKDQVEELEYFVKC